MSLVKLQAHKAISLHTIAEIASLINGKVNGNSKIFIKGVCDIKDSKSEYISYINNQTNVDLFYKSESSAFIVNNNFNVNRNNKTLIHVDDPTMSFIDVINLFHPKEKAHYTIHSSSVISSLSTISKKVTIGPNVIIEDNVTIKDNVIIGAGTYIGKNSIINENTTIYPNVTVYHNIKIGKDCIIDSGSVIGADGFGLAKDNKVYKKMPHIGGVIIKDKVCIGANCCIDRATFGNTIIGEGTKFDNFIQIAHNVSIGKNCRISGQTAIAGSTVIEDNVTLAGQVGVIDHLKIGKGSTVAAKSGVFQSTKPLSIVSGTPAKNHKDRLKHEAIINKLPDIVKRIRKLEK